jgi:cytoskeletal protein CcmA (bactofilin family)
MGFFSNNKQNGETHKETTSVVETPLPSTNVIKEEIVINQINNQVANTNNMQNATIISAGSKLEGTLQLEGELIIDGTVKGSINSKGKVTVGTNGKVEGDINCADAEINGHVNGKINVKEMCFLKSNAKIDGDIITNKLVIENGVQFNGKCNMGALANNTPKAATTLTNNGVVNTTVTA